MFRGFLCWLTEAAAFWTSFGVLLWHELLFYGSFAEIPIFWMQVSFPCSDCLCVVFFTVSCLYCVQMPFFLISTMEKLAWSQLILHHTVDYQLLVHLINNKNRHEIPFHFTFDWVIVVIVLHTQFCCGSYFVRCLLILTVVHWLLKTVFHQHHFVNYTHQTHFLCCFKFQLAMWSFQLCLLGNSAVMYKFGLKLQPN